ncbi:MAG: hypothetical protein U0990_09470 [Candidatus Nanopelagicales bacterium]|nr:hypothetical protein [Candidatus Nanopelagicales bacterium]
MEVDQIAAVLAQHLWLTPLEIVEEAKGRQWIVFGSPSGLPLFSINVVKSGFGDWRVVGVRADVQDQIHEFIEVVHGERERSGRHQEQAAGA